jgi:hypothetical protein
MRYEAAGAAGELALTPAVKPLIQLLDDADSAVRETAALALGKIGGRDARRALETCLKSSDRRLAEAANDALEELAFNSESSDTPLMDYSSHEGRASFGSEDDLDEADEAGLEDDDFDDYSLDDDGEWADDELETDDEDDWDEQEDDSGLDEDFEDDEDWPRRR